jgi:hypothetical protein
MYVEMSIGDANERHEYEKWLLRGRDRSNSDK